MQHTLNAEGKLSHTHSRIKIMQDQGENWELNEKESKKKDAFFFIS